MKVSGIGHIQKDNAKHNKCSTNSTSRMRMDTIRTELVELCDCYMTILEMSTLVHQYKAFMLTNAYSNKG